MSRADAALARLLLLASCQSAWFWLPTSYLLFEARFGAGTAVALLGAYYLAAVVLEVPSGWFSDRFGRRATLVLAMALQAAGGAAIALGHTPLACTLGQVGLAGAAAFVSGTDTALLFDWLKREGRLDELVHWESRTSARSFATAAAAVMVGGLSGTLALWIGHALTALAGLVGVAVALGLADAREPDQVAGRTRGEWARLARAATRGELAWLATFAVAMQVFNHVPLEFHQPYVAALGVELLGAGAPSDVTGLLLGAMMALAAGASRLAPRVGERLGRRATLLACFAGQIAIVWAMALVLHPLVLLAVACRGVPHGLAQPVRNAWLHGALAGPLRATFFSAQALLGSLALGLSLLLASRAVGGPLEALGAETLADVLLAYAVAAGGVLLLLCAWRPRGASAARAPRGE